jgi:2-amino-4-hydroxy-6-hydroxymethyldihydropteridine diphosphokinase
MRDFVIAFIGLGSNVGDRLASMRRAVALLTQQDEVFADLKADVASLFETAPVGGPAGQAKYFNSVIRLRTRLEPAQLMEVLFEVERKLGRTRRERWESRVIDLDLLLYGNAQYAGAGLIIPHPRLYERRFVLAPLAEIAGHVVHPKLGKTIAELNDELPSLTDDQVVRVVGSEWAIQ